MVAESKVWFAEGSYAIYSSYPPGESWGPTARPAMDQGTNGSTDPHPVSRRHKGGSNLVFFDGHGAWMKFEDITAPTWHPWQPIYRTYWDVDSDVDNFTP